MLNMVDWSGSEVDVRQGLLTDTSTVLRAELEWRTSQVPFLCRLILQGAFIEVVLSSYCPEVFPGRTRSPR
jgi:hypothetical protein